MTQLSTQVREALEEVDDSRVEFAYGPDNVRGAYVDGRRSLIPTVVALVEALESSIRQLKDIEDGRIKGSDHFYVNADTLRSWAHSAVKFLEETAITKLKQDLGI